MLDLASTFEVLSAQSHTHHRTSYVTQVLQGCRLLSLRLRRSQRLQQEREAGIPIGLSYPMHCQPFPLPLPLQRQLPAEALHSNCVSPETETITVGRLVREKKYVATGIAAGRQSPLWRYLTKFDLPPKNVTSGICLIVEHGIICNHILKHTSKNDT